MFLYCFAFINRNARVVLMTRLDVTKNPATIQQQIAPHSPVDRGGVAAYVHLFSAAQKK